MSERIARLRAHECNIERYERLLQSDLNEAERRFVNQRLSEERRALELVQLMSPSNPSQMIQLPLPDALR